MIARDAEGSSDRIGMGYLTSGIGLIAASPLVAFRSGPGEQLAASFEATLTRDGPPVTAFASLSINEFRTAPSAPAATTTAAAVAAPNTHARICIAAPESVTRDYLAEGFVLRLLDESQQSTPAA